MLLFLSSSSSSSPSGAGVLWIPSLDSLPRRQLHGPVPLPPPSAGKLAATAAIAFSLHKLLNIFIQTYQQNMSTMCDGWIIVLFSPAQYYSFSYT